MENPAAGLAAAARLPSTRLKKPTGPAAVARLPGTTRRKKPAVASEAGYQGWALLDPSILEEDPAANSTGLAVDTTSDGREVRVSLRVAEPPASSYVQLHTDADLHVEPTLLSADGHLLLVHTVVAVVRDPPFTSFEDNFFVYKPHPNPAMGWLRLLPQFADRVASVRHIGIACRGQDYVVAGFLNMVVGDEAVILGEEGQFKEVGTVTRFSSSTGRWDLLELPIPFDTEKGLYEFVWESDDKFALDGYMFWVDYHRGMLRCDVFAESPSLQFVELPGILIWGEDHDYSQGRQLPEAHRIVGVSRGQVKFVDIDNGLFGTQKTSGFTITTWSLSMNDLQWVKDAVVEVDDLWLLPEFLDSPLPRWVPEYPVLRGPEHESNILHLILRGPEHNAKAWVITLDTREKALKTYKPFINERKLVFEGNVLDMGNIFCGTPFVGFNFDCMNKTAESLVDPMVMNWATNLVCNSGMKKRKTPSSSMDFLELCESSDDDDVFSEAYDSDSSFETPADRAMRSLSLSFFEVLKTLTVEEITDQSRQWHCPVCQNDPGSVVWYKGLNALMDHAKPMASGIVDLHGKLVLLLEHVHQTKLVCQPVTKACFETDDQKRLNLKIKMALNSLKLHLKGRATRRGAIHNMARGTFLRETKHLDFRVEALAGF